MKFITHWCNSLKIPEYVLSDLRDLQKLNLSDNQIGYIDLLSNLTGLRTLFLSDNLIEDLAPYSILKITSMLICQATGSVPERLKDWLKHE